MPKPKILIQLDADPQPSVFDAVVAIDAGAEQLLRHGGITAQNVASLVHGAIFTRGPADLKSTAIFVGGSDVLAAEGIAAAVAKTFFGPMRVSVLIDPSGANTTAAAAVLSAAKHCELAKSRALVLGGTGPVGQRVARLLARAGASVSVASRARARSQQVVDRLLVDQPDARLTACETSSATDTARALESVDLLIAAGAAGAQLVSVDALCAAKGIKLAIDLNAVPPVGIQGIEVGDRGKERHGMIVYGAIGVGGTKTKLHKAAVRQLFERNDQLLDAEQIYALGENLSD